MTAFLSKSVDDMVSDDDTTIWHIVSVSIIQLLQKDLLSKIN